MEQQEKLKLSCVKEKKMLIAYEISHTDMTITSKSVKALWLEWYPEDATYFDMLEKEFMKNHISSGRT